MFNFEDGCYAKTSIKTKPAIYHAIKGNASLENIWIDLETQKCRMSYFF